MNSEEKYNQKLARAKKRVKELKKFYRHLRVYLVVNLILFFFKFRALRFFEAKGMQDEGFLNWFDWNLLATPVLWGIGLLVHAFYVFVAKPTFIKDWEQRQIEKYMNEHND